VPGGTDDTLTQYLWQPSAGMQAEGRRILLFSQFTSMLTLIEAELKSAT